ncbi:MAG: cyanoexosortase A system-associated protein [Symploca sp. SIO1C4]|uniref:Cyanoexosortase A system-associated protein n=1 Tax=Symploca sp. SIO1C4 TaxID=2607765 RepID=A0A6B3NBL9_9CYAN|nr:cyanoexosortase A system-associated protein [Symploca sp. SIO1C4]NET03504.1 cyanoexosortase A system-associated protein [Symploca sp. SIO2B6]
MMLFKRLRIPFLTITCSGVILVLGKLILAPNSSRYTAKPFVLPSEVPLAQWQSLHSQSLFTPIVWQPNLMTSRNYQYQQNNLSLDIEMRYLVPTNGNVQELLQIYTTLPASAQMRQQEEVGFYYLLADEQQAHLSSCINPRGKTTVTEQQFTGNGNRHDLQLNRLLPWLMGEVQLRDRRCLWTHLSISVENTSPSEAYQILEKAWFSWYQWWQPRFPKS